MDRLDRMWIDKVQRNTAAVATFTTPVKQNKGWRFYFWQKNHSPLNNFDRVRVEGGLETEI